MLYGEDLSGNMHPCTGSMPVISKSLHEVFPVSNQEHQNIRDTYSSPTALSSVLTTRPRPFLQNGLAPAEGYYTSATTASRFRGGTIVHRSIYNCHWCIVIVYHYNDVIMGAMASQINSLTIVCSTVSSNAENVSIWWRHHVEETWEHPPPPPPSPVYWHQSKSPQTKKSIKT